ncbi:MAG: hypothetical protein PHY09_12400 [Desulfuromonadaceae bacterium]|nr:hypothetical protein [Desulfuromonadaceae bacterium]MDD5106943.1 hypothetical protein [Desulfuromonadaceae bacterium]
MIRKMTLVVTVALSTFAGTALCADWKFFGEFASGPGVEEAMFYDAESILNSNNSLKLWVKTVLSSTIKEVMKNEALSKKANEKVAGGYIPPLTSLYPKISNVAIVEVVANEPFIKTKTEILYQIMCNEKKMRKISGASYKKDGSREGRFGITAWERIAPESNAGNLAKIVCGAK